MDYTIKDVRAYTGLTRKAFAEKLQIPLRTVEDWEAGARKCPDYTLRLLAHATGYKKEF